MKTKVHRMGGPVNRESVVQQVINKITDSIMTGELKPGDKLPTELELIETFGVSRNSLRSALQTLRAYGVIEVRRPEGTFVCDGVSPQVLNPMLYSILLRKSEAAKDVVELRQVIDFGVSKFIVQQGLNSEDQEKLEKKYYELVEAIMTEKYDINQIACLDMEFHSLMAQATNNSMLVMLNEFLLNITSESRYRTIKKIYSENDREYLVKAHRVHLDALEQKEGSNLDDALNFSYYYWKNSYDL